MNRPKTHREIQSAVETVGVRNLRDRSGPLNFTVRGRIVVLSKPVRVVGAVAAIAAVPLTALAGLAVSNQAPVYLLFVVTATAFVGTAAMLLFPLMLMVTGTSRAGFCVAGGFASAGAASKCSISTVGTSTKLDPSALTKRRVRGPSTWRRSWRIEKPFRRTARSEAKQGTANVPNQPSDNPILISFFIANRLKLTINPNH